MTPLHEVILNKKTTINPIWVMRQAGRYLPEFREIRKKNPDFIKLCLNEKLSSEITLQPIKRFNLDAAIIFSDILMLPYGLNQKVEFKKNFGPILEEFQLNESLLLFCYHFSLFIFRQYYFSFFWNNCINPYIELISYLECFTRSFTFQYIISLTIYIMIIFKV